VLNVLINLGSVKDEGFKLACRAETEGLVTQAGALCERVVAKAKASFGR
jgi:formiminotetrahydrofolate cyclodeaminase